MWPGKAACVSDFMSNILCMYAQSALSVTQRQGPYFFIGPRNFLNRPFLPCSMPFVTIPAECTGKRMILSDHAHKDVINCGRVYQTAEGS